MKHKYLKIFLGLFFLLSPVLLVAQVNYGMATGNYAGIAGVWMNPASIADSRYKYDINIFGYDSYFNNNYLFVKKDAVLRRIFYKQPYSSSYADAKKDLLEEDWPVNGNVNAVVVSNALLPLSFMATTGKKSAIAFTMGNRLINKVSNMNPDLARMIYNEIADPGLYGKAINIDTMQYNFLNWQEVGFTYSRIMVENNHHMLKAGFTGKWLGANAGAYIQTDKATVTFSDSTTMSINSPLIHYARTETADIGTFSRFDLFNNLADQSFGWDFGIVYEFRAKIQNFKYIDETKQVESRRDLNKYLFRIGVSVVDMGKFTLKKKPLTNDHAAAISDWNFSDVHASNFTEWDSAYSQKINYIEGAPSTFTYRLPSSLIGNIDIHLFGGMYINVLAKAPIVSLLKNTDTYIKSDRWTLITPRFEGKAFGLYVPVNHDKNRTNVGATIRIGPFYFGSNNLATILSSSKTKEADFHAGFRYSIPYGKPSKLNKYLASLVSTDTITQDDLNARVDSLQRKVNELSKTINDSTYKKGVNIYVQNYGVESSITNQTSDSLTMKNYTSKEFIQQQDSINNNINKQTDTLLYALAAKNLENEELKKQLEAADKDRKGKSQKVKQDNNSQKVESKDKAMTKEISKMRKQMAIQNAILITGVALANKDDKKDTVYAITTSKDTIKISDTTAFIGPTIIKDSISVRDSISRGDTISIRDTICLRDTIIIRDTVFIKEAATPDAVNIPFSTDTTLKFEPITFLSGSYAVKAADRKRLEILANQVKTNPGMLLEITAINDATGSVTANRKIANKRLTAVNSILIKNGVKDSQLLTRSLLANETKNQNAKSPRRIEIRILKLN